MTDKLPTSLGDLRLGAAKTCPRGYIMRKGYTTRKGVRVGPHCTPDTGKPGKTPPKERILPKPEPGGLGGWSKDLPEGGRQEALKRLTGREGCGTVIKRLVLLRNLTADAATKRTAQGDEDWLRKQGFCRLKTKAKKK